MDIRCNVADNVANLVVEGSLTIDTAAQLRRRLVHALQDHASVRLDLSSLTDIDAAGLQLLIMIRWEAKRQCREMQIAAHHPVAREMAGLANLVSYLAEPAPAF